jgi:rSAM/selenodomain-associated transferase 1
MTETLIICSRYPEAGKTKTRMIPALGAVGAAELQRQMTQHTIKIAKQLQLFRQISIEVYFAGGSRELMSKWLGKDFNYYPQPEGDLGFKMQSAFERAFNLGQNRVVTIGIDCPDIDLDILQQAFDSLKNRDLVLGPAIDGGYYLIGMKTLIPELFADINWGTSEVFTKTQQIADNLQLKTTYLTTLRDVDRPEDLFIWQKHRVL